MGWPIGWTDSVPLETGRFRQWLRSHGVSSPPLLSQPQTETTLNADHTTPAEPRVHSPSSLSLAKQCRHAWALCYVDKLRKPEVTWEQCLAHDAWKASEPPPFPLRVRSAWLASEPFKPEGGQRGAALGGRVHLYAEWHMSRVDDADVYGPRRVIDWESLPGQILTAMVPHLPAEPIDRTCVEVEQRVTVDGVMFRCIADVLHGGVWDHKTSKDIRAYALMSHDVAIALGVPERSLRDDLQACINALAYADTILADRESDERITCNWTYAETTPSGKTRRVLPVRQEIPIEHTLGVVRKAAELAKTLTYETSADAPADTLRCDDYGGCWYRRAGHCTKPRRWGGVFRQLELKEETKMALGWKELQAKQNAANGTPAPVKAAPVAPKVAAPKPAKVAAPKPAKVAPKPPALPVDAALAEGEEELDAIEAGAEDASELPDDADSPELPAEPVIDLDAFGKLLATAAAAISSTMKLVREAKDARGGK
jgi:hypothetical protein